MTTEFNLSEKRKLDDDVPRCFYWEEDVKEFIRLLKEELVLIAERNTAYNKIINMWGYDMLTSIDKLAGDKLI